ncbi:ATP-binding protein [uncultured Ruminococcus sp.]|uniref:ATP-binding protein n=1 Tax=uncultured Ruminococcus sp. TaxID=165186 RepID=UPI0025F405A2|nr:ATP-binding protein [uncultured Ruminococcus sp.]
MATVGKNILDNLTTGMYSDSKVIYREYIQNACDQIDLALSWGLLTSDEANVDICIDSKKRFISIRDNATGVKSESFIEDVGDIANSNKEIGKNKGFRGIGRLCGLAYCKTLKFITSYSGESIKSIMTCDAQKMRAMLIENKKYTLDEIWDAIVSYSTEYEDETEHYFEVEMFDINKENTDLLDDSKVREYLSFVAPVPYKNTFILRSQIYNHAKEIGYKIDEYCIRVNGSQLFKEYTTKLKEASGTNIKNYDEISKLEFKDFMDDSGELIAWMWIGHSRFEKQIPKVNQMRGLRIRSANIQLGNDDALQNLFKEPRGNYYFVGEVFAVNKQLVPNSQRNYFNENEARVEFENALRIYFFDVLHKLYYEANRVKNDYKRQEEYIAKVAEYQQKEKENGFIDEQERQKLQFDIEKAKKSADEARKRLDKLTIDDDTSPMSEVRKSIGKKYDANKLKKKAETTMVDVTPSDKKKTFVTSGMSKLSRSERKIVTKILSIITDIAPKDIATQIIEKIKEEMR